MPKKTWETWSTREDVDGLVRWAERFGPGYQALLVFAYQIVPVVRLPEGTVDLWHWRGRDYLFRAVPVEDYRRSMRVRSPRWGTVGLPGAVFRDLVFWEVIAFLVSVVVAYVYAWRKGVFRWR